MLPSSHSVLLFAPVYTRSGYGMNARALAVSWYRLGIRFRIVPVNGMETGIDDFDMEWLRSMESTPLTKPLAALFYHVPSRAWLDVDLPKGCLRIMYTTFDSSAQGNLPPTEWVEVCNQMDQLWLQTHQEAGVWAKAGMDPEKIHVIAPSHPWVENPVLPPVGSGLRIEEKEICFLSIGMFQPRRRWDALMEAFLREFADEPRAQLYLKVNYPSWHPVPGKPREDLADLIACLRQRVPSKARIVVDEELGTRMGICQLIDRCDFYVSTDTCLTAPVIESLIRGKRVILGVYGTAFPELSRWIIPEAPDLSIPMTPEMLAYQPHHQDRPMPLLRIEDVRQALRSAFSTPLEILRTPWEAWDDYMEGMSALGRNPALADSLAKGFSAKNPLPDASLRLLWEGSQFVHHSLAHVNRQLCLGLLRSGQVEMGLVPYQADEFDGSAHPVFRPLSERIFAELSGPADVHVRHQWPPNLNPPSEGAWVMIQPWEYGGIPAKWVSTLRDLVDEVWVPTRWVKECYVSSGIPEEKVVVVPNGVDADVFRPEGERYPLRTGKGFRFLFLGGTVHRKGIDVLLKAYVRAFRAADDVCLVIKGQAGMAYEGSELDAVLAELARDPESPEIEYLVESLDEQALVSLYRACDAFVLPYRGEGFGLPIAEAMACGLPVIVTGRGASTDFVREDWAYLVKSEPHPVPKVFGLKPSERGFWLEEPDEESLVEQLRRAYEHPEETREKGRRGRAYAEAELGWDRAVAKVLERIEVLRRRVPVRFTRFGQETPPDAPKCLFLLKPDLTSASWIKTLLAYSHAFKPGDPVALGIQVGAEAREPLTWEILRLMEKAGHPTFPDIMMLEDDAELRQWEEDGGVVIDLAEPGASQGHPVMRHLERALALFEKA